MSSMTKSPYQLHVFFFPFMSPGHQIPMIDMARLLAAHGVKATIITTPLNKSRFHSIINRDVVDQNQTIKILTLDFPFAAANLPPNCENLDSLPSRDLSYNLSKAIMLMQPQADDLVHRYQPDAIISDLNIPWTAEIAVKYGIPRLVFHGSNFFALCLSMAASQHKSNVQVSSDSEPFLVPDLPQPVFITMNQMPDRFFNNLGLQEFFVKMIEADRNTYGVVANTFFEIEPEYVKHYEKVTRKVVFPIGPVSLFNTKAVDMVERGNRASIGKDDCMSWLDSKEPNSVIYVCFGSLCKFAKSQLVEISLGLEASKKSFIWVIKDDSLMEDFEKRVKDRGLVIKGWAPQVLILNHPAIGWFMTHCGWNSVLESVCSGVPMITWPLFAEQFYNENFVINQLKIGVPIGVERGLTWGEEEEIGVLVRKEQVEEVVSRLMNGGDDEVVGIRKRVNQLRESARMATSKGGSSYRNIGLLLDDLSNQRENRLSQKRETSDY